MPKETFLKLKPDKKAKIVEAIINELSEHPYEHVNLANIIRDANIARGSFYQYFEDKDDLYMFLIMHVGEVKSVFFKDLFDINNDISFIERFKQIYLRGFIFARECPKLVQASYHIIQSAFFKNSDLYKNSNLGAIQFFDSLIKIDQEKGIIRRDLDGRFLSESLLSYMNTLNIDHYTNTTDISVIEGNVDKIIDLIKKGIENHV